jgi:hypothetical protein
MPNITAPVDQTVNRAARTAAFQAALESAQYPQN